MNNPFETLERRLEAIEDKLDKIAAMPTPETETQEKLLTTNEFCEFLSISRVTLWQWDKKGLTNPVRIGNLKRYRVSDLNSLRGEGGQYDIIKND